MALSPNSLKLQEQVSVTYGIVLPYSEDLSINDLLDPTYWKHHSSRLRGGDKIEVRTEANVFYAELFVVDVGNMAVKMKVINIVDLQGTDESKKAIKISNKSGEIKLESSPGYTVKWVSPTRKFGVLRDGHEGWIRTDFDTKEEARKWAASDLKAMAA